VKGRNRINSGIDEIYGDSDSLARGFGINPSLRSNVAETVRGLAEKNDALPLDMSIL
jgi:hypothetical protein